MKILVVDDERLIRWSIKRMLGRLGHTVQEAEDLESARRAVREEDYDVVLCDFRMPDGSGADLLKDVRRIRPGARFVFMSGDLGRAGEADPPADGCLEKPFLKEELLAAIRPHGGSPPCG